MLLELLVGCFKHIFNDSWSGVTCSVLASCWNLLSWWPGCKWVLSHLSWPNIQLMRTMSYFLEGYKNWHVFQADPRSLWGQCLFFDPFPDLRAQMLSNRKWERASTLSAPSWRNDIQNHCEAIYTDMHLPSEWRPGLAEIQVFQIAAKYFEGISLPLKVHYSVKIYSA